MKKLTTVIMFLALSITYAGTPRDIYWDIVDQMGAMYDFSAAPYDNVTAKAWITSRPLELQTTTASNIVYLDMGTNSVIQFNAGNFTTPWTAGDGLNIEAKDESMSFCSGEVSGYILDATSNPIFGGLGTAGTIGIAISLGT
ncbi:MAG: hypothetical protein GQ534_05865 [Candidatus Delongbacteria bacterium]|nr:hypothetical protein [Candidatus Delongbacteria bacterium]